MVSLLHTQNSTNENQKQMLCYAENTTCSKSSVRRLLCYGFSQCDLHRFPMDQWEEAKQRGKAAENDLSVFVFQIMPPHMNIFHVSVQL